jgi:large subunit ribosomal protein L17
MRKNVFGRQFKRDANERKALFKNLLTSLVLHERIRTTEAKAKAIKGAADKLITKAKTKGDQAHRQLHADINQDAVTKVIDIIAPRFTDRKGGYTRIIRDHRRVADNAPMVYLEWTERSVEVVKDTAEKETKEKKVKEVKETKPKQVVSQKAVKTAKEPVQKQTRSRTRSGL